MKTDFRQKWAVAGPFFHQSGQFQGVRRPKFRCGRSRQFDFFRCTPETGRFGRFSGPRGPKENFVHLTHPGRQGGHSETTPTEYPSSIFYYGTIPFTFPGQERLRWYPEEEGGKFEFQFSQSNENEPKENDWRMPSGLPYVSISRAEAAEMY